MAIALPAEAQRLLDFWFDVPGSPAWNTYRRAWFKKDAAFDATVRAAFLPTWQAAVDGAPDDWSETPEGACARIVLLDQFPRNMFRGDPRSFATDAQALALTRRVIALGWDHRLPTPHHRMFCYMPLQHAEEMEAQQESVQETIALRNDTGIDQATWAEHHRDIIARFGRFPHRNAVLGRACTAEEIAFLGQPGSSF